RGNARPAERTVAVSVEVPADLEDGRYSVTATATGPSGLSFAAEAEILITRAIDFDTGTADEIPWLRDAGGSASNGPQNRFADGTRYFVYKFPFPAGTTSAEAVLTIDNQYVVEVSSDAEDWTTVLREEEEIRDGSNKADQTIDLIPYLGDGDGERPVYVRVSDSFPDDGWGGRVYHVAVDYS